MRRQFRAFSVIFFAAVMLFSSLGLDNAAAQSGYALDGTNPGTAAGRYCANGSYAIWSTNIYAYKTGQLAMYVEVRYSPSCGTNWVRTHNYISAGTSAKTIQRKAAPSFYENELDTGYGWSHSMQVYAPGATCVTVQVSLINYNSVGGVIANTPTVTLC